MTQGITKLDPRFVLQLMMQSYADVHAKTGTIYLQKVVHEELLNVGGIIVGSGALVIETCCLVVDWMYKVGKNCIGFAQYASDAQWLARSKEYLSHRPPAGERIEKIVSRILGVIGTLFGIVLVLWDRGDWIIKLHKDLRIDVHIAPSASSRVTEQEVGAPPSLECLEVAAVSSASPEPAAKRNEETSPPAAATSVPPAPPYLPSPHIAAASSTPKVVIDFKKEIERRGGQEKKVFTMGGRKREKVAEDQRQLTIRSGIQAGLQGKKEVVRFKSVNIEHRGTEGFRIKGHTKLQEIADELGLVFEVPADQLDDSLDSYIFSLNGESPKPGEVLEIKYDHIENANFTIKIIKVVNGTVELVVINYL